MIRLGFSLVLVLGASSMLAADRPAWWTTSPGERARLESFRPAPDPEFSVDTVVDVATFRRDSSDRDDDLAVLRGAFEKAGRLSTKGSVEIRLEPKTYVIEAPGEKDSALLELVRVSNLRVEGQGAMLILKNPTMGVLRIANAKNVVVRNIRVDYDPPPFAELNVETVTSDRELVARLRPGFPSPDSDVFRRVPSKWGYFVDASHPGRLKEGVSNNFFYEVPEPLGDGRFRIRFPTGPCDLSLVQSGDILVLLARGGSNIISVNNSERVIFQNLTAMAGPSLFFGGNDSSELAFLQCRAEVAPGRNKSINGDGVHLQNNRTGPWIEGCHFEGQSDDGVNIYQVPAMITEVDSANQRVRLARKGSGKQGVRPAPSLRAGDDLELLNLDTRTMHKAMLVRFDGKTGWGVLEMPSRSFEDLRVGMGNWRVFNANLCRGAVVVNNSFRNSRRFGTLLKARDALVQGNTFEGLSGSPVMALSAFHHFQEGLGCHNVEVVGNQLRRCGFSAQFLKNPRWRMISFDTVEQFPKGLAPDAYWHSDITIRKNTMDNDKAIFLLNVDGAVVESNVVEKVGSAPQAAPVLDAFCRNLNGNYIDQPPSHSREMKIPTP